jgi:SAM-dependent methyltransferase
MAHLLFPGRHLLNTAFQKKYLYEVLSKPVSELDILGENSLERSEKIEEIIFAVTSANQSNSRYNPVPFWARVIAIDRFAQDLKKHFGVKYRIIGIPHYPPNDHYVDLMLKEIQENTPDRLIISPENTLVLCSTDHLIDAYRQKKFGVLTAEYDHKSKKLIAPTPVEIVRQFSESKGDLDSYKGIISDASLEAWSDFPEIPKTILRIWRDPLLTESGSLTSERNYSTYAIGMGHTELINLKYKDIKGAIVPGKIVDEGCADGALIVQLAKDFPDSDILGIEITSEFMARCLERQRAGEFGGTFVHFHQRNLLDQIFEDNSIDSTICNSTTHELWSYAKQQESLSSYIEKKYKQLRPGGRLIIRDVVGPEDKETEVWLKANSSDGNNEEIFKEFNTAKELEKHLAGLSTHARFKRFAKEFLSEMREAGKRDKSTEVIYREENIDGIEYFVLALKDAVEFMSRKDYFDNWNSELNEEFTFFSFSEWKKFLINHGFKIIENPNLPLESSRVYTNDWIVENRYKGKTELFRMTEDKLIPMDYPPTNIVLVAEKITPAL